MKKLTTGVILAAAVVGGSVAPAAAQFYIPPQCEIDTKHFLVKQAEIYVKAAAEAKEPEKQNTALQDAFRVLNDALGRGEEINPGVWYFLGRAYAMVPDYRGADSAFAKVENLMPDCEEDTDTHRYQLFVNVYNVAVEALQAEDWEAARVPLSQATAIYHKEPYAPFYLANVYAQASERDSALAYFKETVELFDGMLRQAQSEGTPVDSLQAAYKENYDLAVFNVARLYHQAEQWDSAIVWYEQYRELQPDDNTAITGLAAVFEAAGRDDDAAAMFGEMMARSDSLSALDLFSTGVSLFQQEKFARAAEAFKLGLDKNPYHRDGIYNLAQSYFAIANPDTPDSVETEPTAEEMAIRNQAAAEMLGATKRLVELDFQNEDAQRLLAAAYQLNGEEDSTLAVLYRLDSTLFDITVTIFRETGSGYDIEGEIRNRKEQEITVPSIEFEFLDEGGAPVGTETFPGATLGANESVTFDFSPTFPGIAAWRYRFERELGRMGTTP